VNYGHLFSEEAFYVGVKLLAEERLNIKGKYDLRDYIKKKGYEFAKDFLERLHKLLELVTLIDDTKNFLFLVMKRALQLQSMYKVLILRINDK
jgi:hypothetical protein